MITAEQLLRSEWPMNLSEDYEGSCACCFIEGEGFSVRTHCWRTKVDCNCEYCGIHITGELPQKKLLQIAKHIRNNNGWTDFTDWTIIVNETIYDR